MFKDLKKIFTTEVISSFFLTSLVLLESIQLLLVVIRIGDFFPVANPLKPVVFFEWQWLLKPEREMFFFRFFVFSAILLQILAFKIFAKKVKNTAWLNELKIFFWVESIFVYFLLSAAFKTVIYDDRPQLARYAFHTLLVLAALNKIFWPKVRDIGKTLYAFLLREENVFAFRKFGDLIFPVIIFLILYLPDPEAVMARIFCGEQFHHYDSFIQAPAWVYTSGNILNIDQISQYGLGMPIMISELAKLIDGFSYLSVFEVVEWGTIVYYLLWYVLLRNYFQSMAMAVVTMLVSIRIQMFHTGTFPFIFALPSATAIRYWFDVVFLLTIVFHLKTNKKIFLWLSTIVCGVAIYYLISVGVYMLAAFYAYLFCLILVPHFRPMILQSKRDLIPLGGYLIVGPILGFILSWFHEGHYLFTQEYWHNLNEFLNYFLSGAGAMPIFGSLQDHNFLASAIGFFLPAFFVMSIILVVTLCYFKKLEARHLFIVVMSIYGLGLNHYYIMLSAITSYYTTGLPFIFVLGYWIQMAVSRMTNRPRYLKVLLVLLILNVYALVTNHNFLAYPNLLSLSRNPLIDRLVAQRLPDGRSYFDHLFRQYAEGVKVPLNSLGEKDEDIRSEEDFSSQEELKAYYRKEFNFNEDALLIQKFTGPEEKVPLLSSFDIKILMQAHRRPFFYHYPLVISRPMRLRMFGVSGMYTTDYFKKTINQLETAKPEYVFMERLYLSPQVPEYYFYLTPAFMGVLEYVKTHYQFYADGKYLVAMKRKTSTDANTNNAESKPKDQESPSK